METKNHDKSCGHENVVFKCVSKTCSSRDQLYCQDCLNDFVVDHHHKQVRIEQLKKIQPIIDKWEALHESF
jgi:hypothetical protein